MAVTTEILRTYRAPRAVIRNLLDAAASDDKPEGRALMWLMAACVVIFVGQWPVARATAIADPDGVPLDARLAGALFAWIFIAPLLAYGIAAASHLVAMLFGGRGSWLGARIALFWTLLCVSPLMLFHGLTTGFFLGGPETAISGGLVTLAFFALWLISLIEVERGPRSAPARS